MIDPQAPAFPLDAENFYIGSQPGQGWVRGVKSPGITTRAHFAAMAMQGLVTFGNGHAAPVAEQAVKYADALIAELNK